jgi:hypothetical protein
MRTRSTPNSYSSMRRKKNHADELTETSGVPALVSSHPEKIQLQPTSKARSMVEGCSIHTSGAKSWEAAESAQCMARSSVLREPCLSRNLVAPCGTRSSYILPLSNEKPSNTEHSGDANVLCIDPAIRLEYPDESPTPRTCYSKVKKRPCCGIYTARSSIELAPRELHYARGRLDPRSNRPMDIIMHGARIRIRLARRRLQPRD